MDITLNQLAKSLNAKIIGDKRADIPILYVLFDSRRLNKVQNTVFFAIVTSTNSGTKYIEDLYNKGVRMFVCQQTPQTLHPEASYLICKDCVVAMQRLAKLKQEQSQCPITCAITGSNGKTITKDWICKLIGNDKVVFSNPKSYNSQIGVPYSVMQSTGKEDIAIFEAGISMPNEMQYLEEIIQPNIGIFTNIGDAHQVNFQNLEQKIDEKLKLFIHCKKLIFHDNKPLLTKKIQDFAKANNIETIAWRDEQYIGKLPLVFKDKASRENAINAYLFCKEVGISEKSLLSRLQTLEQEQMRFEIKQGINNSTIIDDCYSNDFTSLEIAVDMLCQMNKPKKLIILSDLVQTSTDLKTLYTNINTLLCNKGIDNLIAIGRDFCDNKDLIQIKNARFFYSTQDYLNNSKRSDYTDKAILIKGARSFNFELISRHISEKGHQSVLEINLSAVADNVRYFRSKLQKDTMLMAMVKASSYGCGGYEVASELERSHLVDYLTVAFADEGVELRKNGIQLPIMVVTPEDDSLEKIEQYNLEPVVHSFKTLEMFLDKNINIHIKLDTGMHRLGFEKNDITQLISTIQQHSNIKVKSIFSHLYGADDEALDKYTIAQISLFEQLSQEFTQAFPYKILRHICNSAGIIRFANAHYDMVRLGIGIYGIGVNDKEQKHLRKVHRLKTLITKIRHIDSGENVSYSRKFVSQIPTTIGVIPIGYADGLNRHLGNKNCKVWVNGQFAPIIGNICMDMCMIDITNIEAKEGDEVVIFGEENPVENLAKALDTIPYEIFTSVSQRIKRVYYFE